MYKPVCRTLILRIIRMMMPDGCGVFRAMILSYRISEKFRKIESLVDKNRHHSLASRRVLAHGDLDVDE